MMKYLIILLATLYFSINAHAQTTVSGTLNTNTTFTKANSPYLINGPLMVAKGVVLTIEPGVEVQFDNNVTMTLAGQLYAVGTPTDSIKFTSSSTTKGLAQYKGIALSQNTQREAYQIKMNYCIVEAANNFVRYYSLHKSGIISMENCHFTLNNSASSNTFPGSAVDSIIVNNCLFDNNTNGINSAQNFPNAYITNSIFINNGTAVVGGNIDNCIFEANIVSGAVTRTVRNSKFYHNLVGLIVKAPANQSIVNNDISYNQTGVEFDYIENDTTVNKEFFKGNKVCHNIIYNIKNTTTISGTLYDVCFCTNDSLKIRASINDGYNNSSVGKLDFDYSKVCVTNNPPPVSIATHSSVKGNVQLYPNPSQQLATLKFNYQPQHVYTIIVKDITGQTVYHVNNIKTGTVALDNSQLPTGIYILQLYNEKTTIAVEKMMVE